MTHRAYVNFWTRDTSDSALLGRFEQLLGTIPLSASHPDFLRLIVRAIGPAETPLTEEDVRGSRAPEVIALAKQYPDPDTEYEVSGHWDLWQPADDGAWQRAAAPLLLLCRGNAYDDGIAVQSGQFEADLGFESLFTGGEDPLPAAYERVGQNIKQLFDWVRAVETALPIERYQLWSEGEENLEARLDEILSQD